MKLKIPKTILGVDRKEAYDRIMAEEDDIQTGDTETETQPGTKTPSQTPTTPTQPAPQIIVPNTSKNLALEDYIILEGKKHGDYQYEELLVAKYRLSLTPETAQAAQKLSLTIQDTAKEKNGRGYIGSIPWEPALKLNLELGGFTLNPRQFIDFINLLKSNKVYNGKGTKLQQPEIDQILDEIVGQRSPWRSEWLDADFKYLNKRKKPVDSDKKGQLWLYSSHQLINGNLEPQYKKLLDRCLMEDCQADILNPNNQGLPTKKGTNLYYWHPRKDNNSVARFGADSSGVDLDCDRHPSYRSSRLGVRTAKQRV